MKSLVISDLHLSDNPLEEYRWGVFDWIHDDILDKNEIDRIFILGDLTEKKDNHSSKLVNRLAGELYGLANVLPVTILRGNHDGIDPECPFFSFLRNHSHIRYVYIPDVFNKILYLPHSRNPAEEWKEILTKKNLKNLDYIFMHQTVKGAVANNGFSMEGIDPNIFTGFNGLCISGDIHKPQQVGQVIYVGSPYPVYFGDDFIGGAIILNDDKKVGPGLGPWERITFKTIRRVMLELDWTEKIDLDFRIEKGDQFKVKLLVNRSDSGSFNEYKKEIKTFIEKKKGILVSIELKLKKEETNTMAKKRKFKDINPETVLNRFCKVEGLDSFYTEKGKEFI